MGVQKARMIKQSDIQQFFFLGIGGIGMSALARYFHHRGYPVAGYDRTPSALTKELEKEGVAIIYNDSIEDLRCKIEDLTPLHTLVVRTPAVPEESVIYTWLRENGFWQHLLCILTLGIKIDVDNRADNLRDVPDDL